MTRKIPLLPTLLVAAAIAVMIGLGVWQIGRAKWKDALLEQYRAAANLPPIAFPTAPSSEPLPLFRWATGFCLKPVGRRAIAGENRSGETGYAHIVLCSTGAEGPGMAVEVGWSKDPNAKWQWAGGPVTGVIAPDRQHRMRLVAASAPPGLQPSALPSLRSIPNNHRFYAVQWFLFAAIALVIYVLALRKRQRAE
ncbi:MAG TPA: SURF1 family protein [Sphingomicrobium sp.]|nr:SURF1 family protein [Sphingomicrobium sp.]